MTHGDWQGKFGTDGYLLVGHESKLPDYARLAWQNGSEWIYNNATDDKRALAYFANPPTGKDRIAAARYGNEVTLTLDAGTTPRRLSLYFLDYDRKDRQLSIDITDALANKTLDRQTIAGFADGRYLTWTVQGAVKITLHKLAGDNAVVSGILLDPPGPPSGSVPTNKH